MSLFNFLIIQFLCQIGLGALYGSKTKYNAPNSLLADWPKECTKIDKLYLISRHGIRQPENKDIQYAKYIENIVNQNSNIKLDWLKTWTNPFSDPEDLAQIGAQNTFDAGARLRELISTINKSPIKESEVDFRSSHTKRTGRSAVSFYNGLFTQVNNSAGTNGIKYHEPAYVSMIEESYDMLLRFFKLCPTYVDAMSKSNADKEEDEFAQTYFPKIATSLSSETGLTLNITDVKLFWDICTFEQAIENRTDYFCSLFDEEERIIMNYHEDIGNWIKRGYGLPITSKIASPIFQDLIAFWNHTDIETEDNSVNENFIIRFAHAETIAPILVFLGLFRDNFPLRNDTSRSLWISRQWQSSNILPFQTNIAFYETECNGEDSIVTYFNERIISLKLSSSTISSTSQNYISSSEFYEYLSKNIDNSICYFGIKSYLWVIGIVFGIIGFLGILIGIFIIYRRRRNNMYITAVNLSISDSHNIQDVREFL